METCLPLPTDIETTLREFEEIDFSLILKNSFHVTLDHNYKILLKKRNLDCILKSLKKFSSEEVTMYSNNKTTITSALNTSNSDDKKTEDLSIIAGKIVTNQIVPRSLFCPFCADEYMFEFTLKDHLKRKHAKEMTKKHANDLPESEQAQEDHLCPYCGGVFYAYALIPKHVAQHHGRNWLQHWQQTFALNLPFDKENNEPSICYASCSPGLSDIFEKLVTKDFQSNDNSIIESPCLKSILKKTPTRSYNPIIGSAASVSIRRHKSELVKRSISVRRELRFDLPPLQKSPPIIRKHRKFSDLLQLFRIRNCKGNGKSKTSPVKRKRQKDNQPTVVTSTPVNFLDDEIFNEFEDIDEIKKTNKLFRKKFVGKWKITRNKNQPLLFSSERFECASCNEKYVSNQDLLTHLDKKHHGAKNFLKKYYKCGQCGSTFFKNNLLVRHCHFQHTPQKI